MKALVVGYGSIGQRHARILMEMGCEVAVVTRRGDAPAAFPTLQEGLRSWQPGYVVVATPTQEHRDSVERLTGEGYCGLVLIEKPLFDSPFPLPRHRFSAVAVAYNLRLSPLLTGLKAAIDSAGRVSTATIYVGSYLPDWRPGTDYRTCYSASRTRGGGVLRDLSHELDYTLWLLGRWRRLTASGGHLSELEVQSEDAFTLVLETDGCPLVTVHLNYLDRVTRRTLVVNAGTRTYELDFIRNTMSVDGETRTFAVTRDDTYRAEHHAMLAGNSHQLCSLGEAMETLLTIEAAERAASTHTWIAR